jgi:tRNA threonylcarbamoyladenosine biosynthesis protein TsaB
MILLIDTAQETGTVALAREGKVLFSEENKIAKEHASWLHLAIGRILSEAKMTIRELEAVSVIAGPGSYTGLRVGMAAAKGFCYALKIPLITQISLVMMGESMKSVAIEKGAWICPMIDARRDEVFTALYQVETVKGHQSTVNCQLSTVNGQPSTVIDLIEILPPQAMILDKNSFEMQLSGKPIIFSGSGAVKWEKITHSDGAIFEPQNNIIQSFARISQHDFMSENWADPVYAAPVYLKEFFSY